MLGERWLSWSLRFGVAGRLLCLGFFLDRCCLGDLHIRLQIVRRHRVLSMLHKRYSFTVEQKVLLELKHLLLLLQEVRLSMALNHGLRSRP